MIKRHLLLPLLAMALLVALAAGAMWALNRPAPPVGSIEPTSPFTTALTPHRLQVMRELAPLDVVLARVRSNPVAQRELLAHEGCRAFTDRDSGSDPRWRGDRPDEWRRSLLALRYNRWLGRQVAATGFPQLEPLLQAMVSVCPPVANEALYDLRLSQ